MCKASESQWNDLLKVVSYYDKEGDAKPKGEMDLKGAKWARARAGRRGGGGAP